MYKHESTIAQILSLVKVNGKNKKCCYCLLGRQLDDVTTVTGDEPVNTNSIAFHYSVQCKTAGCVELSKV